MNDLPKLPRSLLDEVLKMPECAEKRDLEWCATMAEWCQDPYAQRAINVATAIILRLYKTSK